jgi:hypothetical protein
VNRRQHRANGQHGHTQHLTQAIRCQDCDSEVTVTEVAPNVYSSEVHHDDSCPWYRAFKRSGGVRFTSREDPHQPEGQP